MTDPKKMLQDVYVHLGRIDIPNKDFWKMRADRIQ